MVACVAVYADISASKELTTQLDLHTPLPSGGAAEVALRAAAIAALEDIASLLDSSVFCGIGS